MSVGADSLMGHLDMNKLLDKETLRRGRAKQDGTNVQIKEVVKAMLDSEPCLFHNSEANLMTVSEGIYVIELPDDQAIALKIADIANRTKPSGICVALVCDPLPKQIDASIGG